ncbi:copper resistance protein CopC [Neokomagataea thailandica NBRC 106555]|uniref:Copper resistance protein CopC n=2 Tax=Neokomagataea TaxID=1223423 RepID=A0A4Y6V6P5_9PROT|nr:MULTISPECIES: copper homeostasis periplasmic binding protein CopC [Neokomagataea]QDH24281.1 copper resistance protein CopC [Neokomagataea tanensis]GBR53026.1 copper resistance protein CopC [Neokomagataea thailandica NBRC 106555]
MRTKIAILAASFVALSAAPSVQAHAKLLTETPAINASGTAPAQITLNFSEKLVPAFSRVMLKMVSMPGMDMPTPQDVTVKSSVSADGKSLVAVPAEALDAGKYVVEYRAVSVDTHTVKGTYMFTVQ